MEAAAGPDDVRYAVKRVRPYVGRARSPGPALRGGAEFASIVARYEAGTLPMVAHDDVPVFLEQMARERAGAA